MNTPRGGDDRAEDGRTVAAETGGGASVDPANSFAILADRHLDSAYRLASVILGDPTDAEDAVHDAAILAWRKFDSLRDRERFEPWLCRIVVNVCRDRLRSRRRHPVVELPTEEDDAKVPRSGDQADRIDTRDAIDRAFARLDPDLQILVALRFYRDLPVDELSERLGIPAGTVKSRLHMAMKRLRRELERQGWTEGRS